MNEQDLIGVSQQAAHALKDCQQEVAIARIAPTALVATPALYRRLANILDAEFGTRLLLPMFPASFPAKFIFYVVSVEFARVNASAFAKQDRCNLGNKVICSTSKEYELAEFARTKQSHYCEHLSRIFVVNTLRDFYETKDRLAEQYGDGLVFGRDPQTFPNVIVAFRLSQSLVDECRGESGVHPPDSDPE